MFGLKGIVAEGSVRRMGVMLGGERIVWRRGTIH